MSFVGELGGCAKGMLGSDCVFSNRLSLFLEIGFSGGKYRGLLGENGGIGPRSRTTSVGNLSGCRVMKKSPFVEGMGGTTENKLRFIVNV